MSLMGILALIALISSAVSLAGKCPVGVPAFVLSIMACIEYLGK